VREELAKAHYNNVMASLRVTMFAIVAGNQQITLQGVEDIKRALESLYQLAIEE
jgi:hypothetical protein